MLINALVTINKLIVAMVLWFALLAPYIYHIVWCIQKAAETGSAIALLIVGIVLAPIGWLHGVCLFFGYTWI